jgi:hypothetical protein
MYKLSTYLVVPYFCYLAVYMLDLLLIEWDTKMKPGNNSVEDHPQLSHKGRASSGWCIGGCWFTVADRTALLDLRR